MAEVLPFAPQGGARFPKPLSDERMRHIAGLEAALRVALEEARWDLEAGMPYLGTALRLTEKLELPRMVVDFSDTTSRDADVVS